jgi:hypothetical protein
LRSPYANNCTPIISYCQVIFLWYNIATLRAWLIVGLLGLGVVQPQPMKERQQASTPQKNHKVAEKPVQPTTPIAPAPCCCPPQSAENKPASAQETSYWKDAFAATTLSNWVLAATAIGAIIIGVITFRSVRSEGEALVNSTRAWVLATFTYPERAHTYFEYSLVLTNHGPTPARIESFYWDTRTIDSLNELPPIPEYGVGQKTRRVLAPKESWAVNVIFPTPKVSAEQFQKAMTGSERYIICLGYVNYGGIFTGERTTKFCFGYNSMLENFKPIGPESYNDAT